MLAAMLLDTELSWYRANYTFTRHHYYPAVKALAMGLQTKGCELGPDVDMEPYVSLTYKALFDQVGFM